MRYSTLFTMLVCGTTFRLDRFSTFMAAIALTGWTVGKRGIDRASDYFMRWVTNNLPAMIKILLLVHSCADQ